MDPVKIIPVCCILVLLLCAGCASNGGSKIKSPATTITATVAPVNTTLPVTTATPAPTPQTPATPLPPLYPDALKMQSPVVFGNGTTWQTEASVYRIWVNDTYRWFNPSEHQYETRVASDGKKFLFVFLSMVNRGTERAPLPVQGNVFVICDNTVITPYPLHPLPMQNPDSPPSIARIAEIEYSHNRYNSEYVEDYGYSHGQKLGYINPGESNAVEGYIIYEVPSSMTPDKSYVKIIMPDKTEGTWVLG